MKGAAKSVGKFVKQNYDVIKLVLSRVADAAIPALATAVGAPELAVPDRALTKSLTGVGLKKGSPEMKAKMARVRAAKKKGGSFKL